MRATTIFAFSDVNLAGQEWLWTFSLSRAADGAFMLEAQREFADPADADGALQIQPTSGLTGGADIFDRLADMIGEAGVEIEDINLEAVAARIATIDPEAAEDFLRGEEILEARLEAEQIRQMQLKAVKMAVFLEPINTYCAQISDEWQRGGGGVLRPSERTRVRAFLEAYVMEHGQLPTGYHSWHLGNAMMSGSRNFGHALTWAAAGRQKQKG